MNSVFTYGSLMEVDIMARVAGHCVNAGAAVLDGYRCFGVKGERYPGVYPTPVHQTAGVLWRQVTPDGLAQLDVFEGDYYERRLLSVQFAGKSVPAWVYVFRQSYRHLLTDTDWDYLRFKQSGKQQFIDQYIGFNAVGDTAAAIYFFRKRDAYFELANTYLVQFVERGVVWPSVEHYFQAHKFENAMYREQIRTCPTPQQAKIMGQSRAVPLRPNWEMIKEDVMMRALRLKFQDARLKQLLLKTAPHPLVENSPHDNYWGNGQNGHGRNRLGQLLMQLRSALADEAVDTASAARPPDLFH